jgi:toxin FitB
LGQLDSGGAFFSSAISILEIELGALQVARRDAAQGRPPDLNRRSGSASFRRPHLGFDTAVAQRCARLHVPDRRSERDALIAATAMVHGLTVVTRNVADFEPIGVVLLNPWKSLSASKPK